MIRIVLIDDHGLMRTGLRMILEKQSDMEIVGEAEDGERGLALIRQTQPDIALVDVHMPGISGVELTERVRRAKIETRIVILTVASEAPFPRRLLEAGVPIVQATMGIVQTWDTHTDNWGKLKNTLLPQLDLGLAAFLAAATVEAITHFAVLYQPERLREPSFLDEATELIVRYLGRDGGG
jgi:CheY-like chemotaxis protein